MLVFHVLLNNSKVGKNDIYIFLSLKFSLEKTTSNLIMASDTAKAHCVLNLIWKSKLMERRETLNSLKGQKKIHQKKEIPLIPQQFFSSSVFYFFYKASYLFAVAGRSICDYAYIHSSVKAKCVYTKVKQSCNI